MYFSIRKTFARLHGHRRALSELTQNDAATLVTVQLPRPSSLPKLDDLLSVATALGPQPIHSSSCPPEASPQCSELEFRPTSAPQYLVTDDEHILALQAENARLREENADLKLDAQIREEELNKFRSDYYAERFKANVRKRLAKSAEVSYDALSLRLEQAEKFIASMVEIGIHQPVLSGAWKAVTPERTSDEALVDAIRKAAATPGTSWSKIIPQVTGPRTSDEYLAAIDMTVKATQELKITRKILRFWKITAKKDPSQTDLVTPSPSKLSDASLAKDNQGRHKVRVVDDLLKQLKSGDIQASRLTTPTDISGLSPSKASSDVISSTLPQVSSASPSKISPHVDPSHKLAPLASQTLKDEVSSIYPIERPRVPPPTKKLRLVFGTVDINHDVPKSKSPKKPSSHHLPLEDQATKLSAKALSKRKAMIIERAQPATNTAPVAHNHDTSNTLHTVLDGVRGNTSCDSSFVSPTSTRPFNTGFLSPEKALLSLERICAGFSSGSLGSLATQDSTNALPSATSIPNAVQANASTSDTVSARLPPQPAPPSLRRSALPIAKFRQFARSPSRKSLFSAPLFRPSGSLKSITTPTKKFLRKNTSPLRITKKPKINTTLSAGNSGSSRRTSASNVDLTASKSSPFRTGRFQTQGRRVARNLGRVTS
ncbi:hypothetical protein Hypma_007918 [Hypsizygus marmoreus]|uniref:Uncharacterized protein n=1 Tax=Hypsizygus marmoreus TaxID=39966 RepID=A0A369JS96_HYPMA|nr:hypothetical protein Hypma_007918 [Hypsizygus marmoreus]